MESGHEAAIREAVCALTAREAQALLTDLAMERTSAAGFDSLLRLMGELGSGGGAELWAALAHGVGKHYMSRQLLLRVAAAALDRKQAQIRLQLREAAHNSVTSECELQLWSSEDASRFCLAMLEGGVWLQDAGKETQLSSRAAYRATSARLDRSAAVARCILEAAHKRRLHPDRW